MEEKKILFKYENRVMSCDIKNVTQEELLEFICEMLENLIENKVVTRELMLTTINMCLAIGPVLPEEELENEEVQKLIAELSDAMLNLFWSITND